MNSKRTSWSLILACSLIGLTAKINSGRSPHPDRTMMNAAAFSSTPRAAVNNAITILPKISCSPQRLSADGTSVTVITISLYKIAGNQLTSYSATEVIEFRLDPVNASFNPGTVKILPGKSESEPATLSAKLAAPLDIGCTPIREYNGLTISQAQPIRIEFFAPINSVGIEPLTGKSTVNNGTEFLVYLYNNNDPAKTHLQPTGSVLVHLKSENESGRLESPDIELNDQHFSHDVRYVGTKMGRDYVVAHAHYERQDIFGKSERIIVFPWWVFFAGLAGTAIGALLRGRIGEPQRRRQNLLESLILGLAFCLIAILFPPGTKLPQISSYIQPALVFALAILVASLGAEFLKLLLSFIPSRS